MQTHILDKQKLLSAESGSRIRERIARLANATGKSISRVNLRVFQEKGPKNRYEKQAKIEVYLEGGGVVLANARSRSLAQAVGSVVERMTRRLREKSGR